MLRLHDRRALLRLAAAGALASAWPLAGCAQPRFGADPFRLGVASGAPDHASVVLWTRLLAPEGGALGAQPVPVRWEVADDEAFTRIVQQGLAPALPELAHSVHVEARGLAPDRWYFYRFMAGDAVSRVGRTRTFPLPAAPAARLRLGYASCQRWEHGYYAAWRHMRAEQPDLVLFLGDYIYEYPGSPRALRWPGAWWLTTLGDYRARHALYKTDEDLQAMHAACPWLVTWDDHEVQNDYAGAQPGRGGPPWADHAQRRAAAYQAWYEHMPVRASQLARAMAWGRGDLRVHTTQRFGRLASLCMLDTRQHKDPQACTPEGRFGSGSLDPATCPAWEDPRRSLLGEEQERWLQAQLAGAGEGWTVLGQSTLFGRRDLRPGPGELLWNDGWDGYPAARRRITQALEAHALRGAVLFGGDVHEHWVGHVKADYERPESAVVGVEFCGTSISSRSAGAPRAAERLAENPHFVFGDGSARGYGLAEFTPSRLEVSLRGLEDVRRPDSGVRTMARFGVEFGSRRIEKA